MIGGIERVCPATEQSGAIGARRGKRYRLFWRHIFGGLNYSVPHKNVSGYSILWEHEAQEERTVVIEEHELQLSPLQYREFLALIEGKLVSAAALAQEIYGSRLD